MTTTATPAAPKHDTRAPAPPQQRPAPDTNARGQPAGVLGSHVQRLARGGRADPRRSPRLLRTGPPGAPARGGGPTAGRLRTRHQRGSPHPRTGTITATALDDELDIAVTDTSRTPPRLPDPPSNAEPPLAELGLVPLRLQAEPPSQRTPVSGAEIPAVGWETTVSPIGRVLLVNNQPVKFTEFAALWAVHDVAFRRDDRKRLNHPAFGLIEVNCLNLFQRGRSAATALVHPAVGTDSADLLDLLAVLGTQEVTGPSL
ncbi:hypothetical protein [Kitasatospora sp. NPDC057015]|uniref:MmyB family transcriptional regulator n=1 Tax=Kitasatospora sp. NPDC057015 TaxID=3346001 RepID=UPI003634C4AF